MKNFKNLSRRLLAVLVALLLCVGTLPVAAFAEEADSAAARVGENTDGGSDGPRDVSDNPPTPSDANVETSTETSVDDEGNTTTTTNTDKDWSYRDEEQSSSGSYGPVTTGGDSATVDKLTGGEDLDEIEDGTYTKTETSSKTDVSVRVEGEEHRTDSDTYDEDGIRTGTSMTVEGTQDTATTVTDTTKVVTTEVKKETGDVVYSDKEDIIDPEEKDVHEVEGAPGDKLTISTEGSAKYENLTPEEIDELVAAKVLTKEQADELKQKPADLGSISDVLTDKTIESDKLTVSETNKTASDLNNVASELDEGKLKEKLLSTLDGWQVKDKDGNVGTVRVVRDASGNVTSVTVKDAAGNDIEAVLTGNIQDGYSIVAEKVMTGRKPGTVSDSFEDVVLDENGDRVADENGNPILRDTERGPSLSDSEEIDPDAINWDEYEVVETVVNEDGSTTVRYVRKGTAGREDTNTWTEVRTRTDGVVEIRQTATVSATIDLGKYDVSAEWVGVKDNNEKNQGGKFEALGPSEDVIKKGLESRKNTTTMPTAHIIIGGYFKAGDKTIEEKAAELAGQTTGEIDTTGELELDIYPWLDGEHGGGFLQSTVVIKDAGKNYRGAWLRRMKDSSGNYFYVYCSEHGKGTSGDEYEFGNTDDHFLYGDDAKHIQYVAENGWWGTDEGTGSLTAVREFAGLKGDKANDLDEGLALAATQAAIWYYTSPDARAIDPDDVFGKCWTNGNGTTERDLTDKEKAAAMALFNALIAKDVDEEELEVKETTDLINAGDITSTSIQVVEKVDVTTVEELTQKVQEALLDSGKVADASKLDTDKVYEANVSVTLAVVPSRLHSDDLMVYVYSGDTLVGTQRVTKEGLAATNGVVTMNNVVLQSGQNVRFHLEGTQELKEGAYLFQTAITNGASASQTMVGYVAAGEKNTTNKVDLDVTVKFDVTKTDPTASSTSGASSVSKSWEETYEVYQNKESTTNVTENYTESVTVTTTVTTVETPISATTVDSVYWSDRASATFGDEDDDDDDGPGPETPGTPETTVSEEPTPLADIAEEPTPLAALSEDIAIPDEETPLAEMPEEELEIPDEEVPLADVPATGDISGAWGILLLSSAAGLLLLTRKKAEEAEG